ncbi:hypothetical protein TI04_12700 [Achromatium sp. WMS2]|nr:hypothetical protein TI04_12700 [Achromatium sp. WMS2]
MSDIQNYYRQLDDLRRVAGADNEGALRPAFQNLLAAVGEEHSTFKTIKYVILKVFSYTELYTFYVF